MAFVKTIENHVYVDTKFINSVQYKMPGASLVHMGFGDFSLRVRDNERGVSCTIDFDRTPQTNIPNQSGRSHRVRGDAATILRMIECMRDEEHNPPEV